MHNKFLFEYILEYFPFKLKDCYQEFDLKNDEIKTFIKCLQQNKLELINRIATDNYLNLKYNDYRGY